MIAMNDIVPVTDFAETAVPPAREAESAPYSGVWKNQGEAFENALYPLLNENKAIWNELAGTVSEKTLAEVLGKVSSEMGVRSSEIIAPQTRGGLPSSATETVRQDAATPNFNTISDITDAEDSVPPPASSPNANQISQFSILNSQISIAASPQAVAPRLADSYRAAAAPVVSAVVSAIQVSPTLATTGTGEIRIELSNEILDGSMVRFEVKKGGELRITVYPATQEAAKALQTNLETFQAQLAERVTQWRVNVGVSAWNPKTSFKETERDV